MDDEVENVVFRDFPLLLLMGFVVLIVLLIPFIANPAKNKEGDVRVGSVIVEISWPEGWNTDVDLWVRAPGERSVGYSNKAGILFNLLRDDLGMRGDTTPENSEIAATRGIVAGEYVANVHLYGNQDRRFPVPVSSRIRVIPAAGKPYLVDQREVMLYQLGEEVTLYRFRLTAEGAFVPGSGTILHEPLRSAGVGLR